MDSFDNENQSREREFADSTYAPSRIDNKPSFQLPNVHLRKGALEGFIEKHYSAKFRHAYVSESGSAIAANANSNELGRLILIRRFTAWYIVGLRELMGMD